MSEPFFGPVYQMTPEEEAECQAALDRAEREANEASVHSANRGG